MDRRSFLAMLPGMLAAKKIAASLPEPAIFTNMGLQVISGVDPVKAECVKSLMTFSLYITDLSDEDSKALVHVGNPEANSEEKQKIQNVYQKAIKENRMRWTMVKSERFQ
jgi:hypothetical protein